MEQDDGQYKCLVTGKRFKSCGGRKAVLKGLADGVHTNVGFVSRLGLERYDEVTREAIEALYLSELGSPCSRGRIRREIKRRLQEASCPESSTDTPS